MHFLENYLENVRKHKDIKRVTTERRRNYSLSEENLLAIEMKKKKQILMNKPVRLEVSILKLSKIWMYEF